VPKNIGINMMIGEPFNFSIVIPTWNRCNSLKNLLGSIVNQCYPSAMLEIIVVDSFSDDGTLEIVKNFCTKNPEYALKYLNVDLNTPSHKRNIGISYASFDWLIFIDDDCILADGYFECCIKSILLISDLRAIFFGEVRYPEHLVKNSNYNRYRNSRHFIAGETPQAVGFIKVTTMNMLCNLSALQESGLLFDLDYKFSCEDTDFSYRLGLAGFNFYTSKATIFHYESCKDIATYLDKCRRVYSEGYRLVQQKAPALAKQMVWRHFSPLRNNFRRSAYYLFLGIFFNRRINYMVVRFLSITDSYRYLYFEKLFMYAIISAYIEGIRSK
jgi:glycosyltransferase involved in cell wall biosynthesis